MFALLLYSQLIEMIQFYLVSSYIIHNRHIIKLEKERLRFCNTSRWMWILKLD